MPKKSTPTKRVPVQVKAFLAGYDENVQKIALKARALVLEIVPNAVEQIDVPAKMLAYGFAETYKDMICAVMPQKSYVNFGLPRGAQITREETRDQAKLESSIDSGTKRTKGELTSPRLRGGLLAHSIKTRPWDPNGPSASNRRRIEMSLS